jgi:HEAT repeat protein
MALVEELVETLQLFAQGQWLLWQQLAGDYGLLRRGLREAVDNQATVALQGCWDALKRADVPRVIARYYYRQFREVDSDRLARNARALVATALVAAWAKQSPPSPKSVEQAEDWARQAAELLGGAVGGGTPGSLAASLNWTTGMEPAELIEEIYQHLAGEGYEVTGARHWSLYWVGASRAERRLRVPVACVVRGQGHLGDLYLELLAAGPDVLIEDPEMALWPVGGSFLETLEQARRGVKGAFSWRFAFRQPQSVGQVPLVGYSAGGAAAVGFRLLAQGQPYDAGCLIVAGIGKEGEKEGELRAVGGEREKLDAAAQGGIRRAVVAPETELSQADREGYASQKLAIEERPTVDDACRFASDLPQQLIKYLRLLEEAPDGEAPPYLAGRKPSELYVAPDVLVRVKRVREEPPGPGGRETVSEPRGVSRLPETALEVGEVYPYGFRVEEADERLAWQRVRKRMEGVQRAVVVLGPPGQGKTQLVRMTARELAREAREALEEQREAFDQVPLPVVVRCQALAEEKIPTNVSAEDELRARIEQLVRAAGASEAAAQYIAGHCDQARCWLFLDALDEVMEPARLQAFWGVLRQWQTRVVLTSRPYAYEGGLPFQPLECRLAPFVARQTRALVERWYAGDSGRANPLLQTLRSSVGLAQMGQNPLLLTLVCWLAEGHPITPDLSRSQLYEWMVRDLLSLDRKGNRDPVRSDELLPLVREIGWRWFEATQGKKALPQGQLREWVWESCHRPLPRGVPAAQAVSLTPAAWADDLIRELAREKRFLAVFEWNRQPAYVFPHRSILEFLAGAELAEKLKGGRQRKWWDFVDRMAWDPGWEGVLLFAAGQLGERVNELASRLLDGEDDIFRHRLASAAMCLAEAPATVRKQGLVDSITKEVWNTCYKESAWVVGELDHLSKAWAAAARLNGRVGNRSLVEELEHRIRQGDERSIELAGRLGLVAWRRRLIPAVLAALESADRSVRKAAAQALVPLREAAAAHPQVIPGLLAALKDRDWLVRWAAARALGALREAAAAHPEVIPVLLAALKHEDEGVRQAAAKTLGELGEAAAARPEVIPALLAALKDRGRLVRRVAAEALREAAAAQPEVIPAVLAALKDGDWRVREGVAQALGELGEAAAAHPEVVPALCAALEDRHQDVRKAAVLALGKLGEAHGAHREVIPALLAALNCQDWEVRVAAAKGLAQLGGAAATHPKVIPALLAALKDQDKEVREAAAETLGELREAEAARPEVIPELLAALKDEDGGVRQAAAKTLGQLGGEAAARPEVIPELLAALKDENEGVRQAAAKALRALREAAAAHPQVIPALLAALEDDEGLVRLAAAWALGGLGAARAAYPEVIPALLAALKHLDWPVRLAAAEALGELGGAAAAHHEVIEALSAALNDRARFVRYAAVAALGKLGATAASRRDVFAAMYKIYRTDSDLAERALALWDRQGLRIFLRRRGFTVRTIAELTQRSRT